MLIVGIRSPYVQSSRRCPTESVPAFAEGRMGQIGPGAAGRLRSVSALGPKPRPALGRSDAWMVHAIRAGGASATPHAVGQTRVLCPVSRFPARGSRGIPALAYRALGPISHMRRRGVSICNSWRPSEARPQHLPDVGRALEHRPPSHPVGRSPAHLLDRTARMGHAWRLAVRVRGRCASPASPNPVSQARANSGSLPSRRHRWRRRRQCGSGVG